MGNIFGVDFRSEIAAGITSAGGLRPGTLIKVSPKAPDPNDRDNFDKVPQQTTVSYSFQGVVRTKEVYDGTSTVKKPTAVLTIIGGTLPRDIDPKIGDKAELDGVTYTLGEQIRGSSSRASYQFIVA